MEKIELRCLKCGEPLDVMPDVRNDETGLHQFVSPCNNCIGEELKFFRNSFPRAAANYVKVAAQPLRAVDAASALPAEQNPRSNIVPAVEFDTQPRP